MTRLPPESVSFTKQKVFLPNVLWTSVMSSSTFIDALASSERGAGLYRARGEREGRSIDIDQLLLFTIHDGLVTEVLALPSDPLAFNAFWAE